MRKWLLVIMIAITTTLVACNDNTETDEATEKQKIRVASVETPMTDVVEIAKEILAEEGIEVELVQMGDYIQPNEALANGEVDANFSQHVPFMEEFNRNKGADLVGVQPVYYPNYGIYSREYDSIENLPDGATIGVANDSSNLDRSLRLLAENGLIELKEIGDEEEYTIADVIEDSHNFVFKEVEIAALSRLYEDVDIAVMSPAHARHIDLTPEDDAIIAENNVEKYAVSLITRKENADSELIQKLAEAMTSEEVREFLNSHGGGSATPAF